MGDDLEARLKSHARAFEGLMSLIPATEYYGKDDSITSTQWQKKKQTKEERQAAKRAKLDPASHKTAKDVMDEEARKRKRELDDAEPDSSDIDLGIEKEKPLEGLRIAKAKKQKTEQEPEVTESVEEEPAATAEEATEVRRKSKAEKRREKRERKAEKLAQKKQKQEEKKAAQSEFSALDKDEDAEEDDDEELDDTIMAEHGDDDMEALDVSGLADEPPSTVTSSSAPSNASSASVASATSSTSSIIPPAGEGSTAKKESKPFIYDPKKQEEYQARLAAKLEALRAARKADGPDGRPARNRAELIEARRKKQAERKAAKKASRQLAKEDEERLKAEEQLARIRGGSGSPSLFPMRATPENENSFNLAFGKVAWKDGQQMQENLSGFLESRKRKGKSDPKTALEAAKKKKQRLSALDEAKRKDIEEKDLWLAAKKRAQGEKVLDDPTLLKKTVKRLEKQKSKSKQEWKERITSVEKGKAMRQKKREENLKKRKEEKGQKGKKGKKAGKPGKKVKRPGFEGTFKAR